MKRGGKLPLWPTLMTALAVPTMLGLGGWQLQRREWKHERLAELAAAQALPPASIATAPGPGMGFRRVRMALDCPAVPPRAVAGRSREGQSGFMLLAACRGGAELVLGWVPPARAVAWERQAAPAVRGVLDGVLIETQPGAYRLYPAAVPAGLVGVGAALPPGVESIPDNHLSYALQWFSFAAIWAAIYAVYVRGWRRGRAA
jgi:cytochrome oxidase assembly protein ShyY1